MSLSDLLKIGDEVIFKVDPERRAHSNAYDTIPDGTKGVVCGFYDAVIYEPRVPVGTWRPGAYHCKGVASIWLPDGRIVSDDSSVAMVDQDEERRRFDALRDEDGTARPEQIRLGDLPATKFWEQDKVRVTFPYGEILDMTVGHIAYSQIHQRRNDGSPYPFYGVIFQNGGYTSAEESWMELIERGNVWNYYHDQPLSFANLEEESEFFQLVGQSESVRNPRTGLYSWMKDEVLEAIKNGIVHGMSVSHGLFGSGPHISAYRFKNEDLGRRVAEATLNGFDVASV